MSIVTDRAVNEAAKWDARRGDTQPITINFSLTQAARVFEATVYRPNGGATMFTLSEANGKIVNNGTNLVITLDGANAAIMADTYEWKLRSDNNLTWFCAPFVLHDSAWGGNTTSSVNITVDVGGTSVDLDITIAASHFRGTYVSLVALQTAIPTGTAGDYADVDAGPGTDVQRYIWDTDDAEWILGSGAGGVTTFNGRSGAVSPLAADYDAFFLTPAEGNTAYVPVARTVNNMALSANIEIPSPILYKYTGRHYGNNINQGAALTHVIGANSIRAYPFVVEKNMTFSAIRSEVASSVGSTVYRLGIYTSDAVGYPASLVANTDAAEYDSSTNGVKLGTPAANVMLVPGLYHIAILSNGAPTMRGFASATLATPLGSFVTIGTSPNITERRAAQAYGAMPSSYPAGATEFSNNSVLVLFTIV